MFHQTALVLRPSSSCTSTCSTFVHPRPPSSTAWLPPSSPRSRASSRTCAAVAPRAAGRRPAPPPPPAGSAPRPRSAAARLAQLALRRASARSPRQLLQSSPLRRVVRARRRAAPAPAGTARAAPPPAAAADGHRRRLLPPPPAARGSRAGSRTSPACVPWWISSSIRRCLHRPRAPAPSAASSDGTSRSISGVRNSQRSSPRMQPHGVVDARHGLPQQVVEVPARRSRCGSARRARRCATRGPAAPCRTARRPRPSPCVLTRQLMAAHQPVADRVRARVVDPAPRCGCAAARRGTAARCRSGRGRCR